MKLNRQTIFTLFIGVMMITWVVGIAFGSNLQLDQQRGIKIESVYERLLTSEEKLAILRSNMVLIEYLHTGGFESVEKRASYENFVARFKQNAVLQIVEIQQDNETIDQMIPSTGDIVPLDNVSAADLVDVFCENSFVQPRECVLRSL